MVIFILYSILLLHDYWGLPMNDTCLFNLNGNSVGLQDHSVIYLSPVLIGIIYLCGLIVLVISAKLKIPHTSINIINSIYAVMLLLFYKSYLLNYPPFGIAEWFVWPIFLYIELSYLALLFFMIFGVYLIYGSLKLRGK